MRALQLLPTEDESPKRTEPINTEYLMFILSSLEMSGLNIDDVTLELDLSYSARSTSERRHSEKTLLSTREYAILLKWGKIVCRSIKMPGKQPHADQIFPMSSPTNQSSANQKFHIELQKFGHEDVENASPLLLHRYNNKDPGDICEYCFLDETEEKFILCSWCRCAFHPGCLDTSRTERELGGEWKCLTCRFVKWRSYAEKLGNEV